MRPISIGSEPSITPEEQPLPELSWVDIDGLVIDDQYQRPLGKANWARIRAIAASFGGAGSPRSWWHQCPKVASRSSTVNTGSMPPRSVDLNGFRP